MHDGVCRVFPPLHLAVNDTGVFPVAVHVVHLGHVTTVCLVDNFEKVVSVMTNRVVHQVLQVIDIKFRVAF